MPGREDGGDNRAMAAANKAVATGDGFIFSPEPKFQTALGPKHVYQEEPEPEREAEMTGGGVGGAPGHAMADVVCHMSGASAGWLSAKAAPLRARASGARSRAARASAAWSAAQRAAPAGGG